MTRGRNRPQCEVGHLCHEASANHGSDTGLQVDKDPSKHAVLHSLTLSLTLSYSLLLSLSFSLSLSYSLSVSYPLSLPLSLTLSYSLSFFVDLIRFPVRKSKTHLVLVTCKRISICTLSSTSEMSHSLESWNLLLTWKEVTLAKVHRRHSWLS